MAEIAGLMAYLAPWSSRLWSMALVLALLVAWLTRQQERQLPFFNDRSKRPFIRAMYETPQLITTQACTRPDGYGPLWD